MSGHYRVLIINGGGVRGIIPTRILKEITDQSDKQIHEFFDFIIGTSIGGIIATALTVSDKYGNLRYNTEDVVNIMINHAQDIFPQDSIGTWPIIGPLHNLFFAKYSREGIDTLLNQKLGEATFLDTIIPIATISYSLDKDQPRVWSTFKAQLNEKYNYFLKDAAGATSAAPTYFPYKITKTPDGAIYYDIDGGIFANSPTFLGMAELLKAKPEIDPNKIIVVSLGTGRFEDQPDIIATDYHETNSFACSATLASSIALITSYFTTFPSYINPNYIKSISLLSSIAAGITCAGSWLSNTIIEGYGQLGWILFHDSISKMMKGTELADTIDGFSLYRSIRINPKMESDFAPLDNGDFEHMKLFNEAVEIFISHHPALWKNIYECLDSRDIFSPSCAHARKEAYDEFKEEFQLVGIDKALEEFTLPDSI